MRAGVSAFVKAIVALMTLALIVAFAMAARIAPASLAARLEQHVRAVASTEHNTSKTKALDAATCYIAEALTASGMQVRRQQYTAGGHKVRNLEVAFINTRGGKPPDRIFIIGAHYDLAPGAPGVSDNGLGTAAVIELARLLKGVRLSEGTELKFVFFVNEAPLWFMGETIGHDSNTKGGQRYQTGLEKPYPDAGNFIAFVGTLGASEQVRKTLAAFKATSSVPAEGLAAPAYVEGVTLSDYPSHNRPGTPALMITETAFLRYPYYHAARDTPDKRGYASMARVVNGLAKVIEAMAAPVRM